MTVDIVILSELLCYMTIVVQQKKRQVMPAAYGHVIVLRKCCITLFDTLRATPEP